MTALELIQMQLWHYMRPLTMIEKAEDVLWASNDNDSREDPRMISGKGYFDGKS